MKIFGGIRRQEQKRQASLSELEKYVKKHLREMRREAIEMEKEMYEIAEETGINEFEVDLVSGIAYYEVLRETFDAPHEIAYNNAKYSLQQEYWPYWDSYFEVVVKTADTEGSLINHNGYQRIKLLIRNYLEKYRPLGEFMATQLITKSEAKRGAFLSKFIAGRLAKKLEESMIKKLIEERQKQVKKSAKKKDSKKNRGDEKDSKEGGES